MATAAQPNGSPKPAAKPAPSAGTAAIMADASQSRKPDKQTSKRDILYGETLRFFFRPVAHLLFEDESISEVMINGPKDIYIERKGKVERAHGVEFPDEYSLGAAVLNLAEFVERHVDAETPTMDARLPEPFKYRVNVIMPPISRVGICVTIRKFKENNWDLNTLIQFGSLTPMAAEYLDLMVKSHHNVIVSGGTGSGKTSLLNALSASIADSERCVVIEDSSELRLLKPHVVYLEARPAGPDGKGAVTIRDCFVNSLRMRPDRIIVGEIRRGEALDLIQSMLSGHDGALSTVHASSPLLALTRLETLCLMNDVGMPVYVARAQVASAMHVIVQASRFPDGSRRVREIAEVMGLSSDDKYLMRPIFKFVQTGFSTEGKILGELRWTGEVSRFDQEIQEARAMLKAFYQCEIKQTHGIWGLDADGNVVAG